LGHNKQRVISTTAPENLQTASRISLTIETILNSQKILVLLQGSKKSDVLAELLEGGKTASEFPAKFLLSHPDLNIFYCDKD
jgi:6-phosphogluconolactonase/glucosamine-6-phosphate isomerase/deaminase